MALIAFGLIAAIVILSAVLVIAARNPVHSVLWLILTFFSAAGLFVLIGAEFLAMLLIVVYVGAVAVLFLFVVMMLDVDFVELKEGTLRYWPFALLVGLIFFGELALVWATSGQTVAAAPTAAAAPVATKRKSRRVGWSAEDAVVTIPSPFLSAAGGAAPGHAARAT